MTNFDHNHYAREIVPEHFHPLLDRFDEPEDKLLVLSWIQRALLDEANELSRIDSLTQVSNQETWYANLQSSLETNREHTAVIVLDLTNFKSINDKGGQALGDAVIDLFSRILKDKMREIDGNSIGRVGGDEFGIIVDLTSRDFESRLSKKRKLEMILIRLGEVVQEIHKQMPELKDQFGFDVAFAGAVAKEHDTDKDLFRSAEIKMKKVKERQHNELGAYRTNDIT